MSEKANSKPKLISDLEKRSTHHSNHTEKVDYDQVYNAPEYTPEYNQVFQFIKDNYPLIFVTGKAGTGKSTLIHEIKQQYAGQVAVIAPTGVAALNVCGQTIHSLFRFAPRIIDLDLIKKVKENELFKVLKIIIIDEISMVRVDLVEGIDRFLRLNGPNASLPFGGIQMIFLGDLFQLPPVVGKKREERTYFARNYKSNYFFSAKALAKMELAAVELKKVFRQSDSAFVDLLSRVRLNKCTPKDFEILNNRCQDPPEEHKPAVLTGNRVDAKRINQEELAKLRGAEKFYQGVVAGEFELEDRDSYPAPERLILKKNARVMFTKNDGQKRWVNGSFGTVRELHDDKIIVELDAGMKSVVDVQVGSWKQYKLTYDSAKESVIYDEIGCYSQFPLSPAWAITIHKSQGQTLDGIQIDLGESGAFAGGQTYVALSRARSMDGIWLRTPIAANDIQVDEKVVAFYQELFAKTNQKPSSSSTYVFPELHDFIPDPTEKPSSKSKLANTRDQIKHAGSSPKPSSTRQVTADSSNQSTVDQPSSSSTISAPNSADTSFTDAQAYEIINAAIQDGSSVEIEYINNRGIISHRVIRPRGWVNDQRFTAFCELREKEQDFVISGIQQAEFLD